MDVDAWSPSPAIHRDLAIDCGRNESIGLDIPELNLASAGHAATHFYA